MLLLGILGSFLVLFYQYIPIAFTKNSLFAPDYYGPSYSYLAKINGVPMGTILISGLTDILIDAARSINAKTKKIFLTFIHWFLGAFLVIYSYAYIFIAHNGIGLVAPQNTYLLNARGMVAVTSECLINRIRQSIFPRVHCRLFCLFR